MMAKIGYKPLPSGKRSLCSCSGVNFINILCARFSYESKLSSFSLVTFGFVIFGAKILCYKFKSNQIGNYSLLNTTWPIHFQLKKCYKNKIVREFDILVTYLVMMIVWGIEVQPSSH